MSRSHAFLKYTRQVHLYLGVFIAPALLFFAFTGALQTFSLHETTRGSSYKPPAWAVTLAQIHKKQTPVITKKADKPVEKPKEKSAGKPMEDPFDKSADKATDKAAASPATSGVPSPTPHNPRPLKIFFLLVSIGLFFSTFSGLYMSYKYVRNRGLITATLLAGIVIPIVLLLV
jgi:hypothetical protein